MTIRKDVSANRYNQETAIIRKNSNSIFDFQKTSITNFPRFL